MHRAMKRLLICAACLTALLTLSVAVSAAFLQDNDLVKTVLAVSALAGLILFTLLLIGCQLAETPREWQVAQEILTGFQHDGVLVQEGETRSPEQTLAEQMLRTQAEVAALQSQINPHFLYNTLETIRGKALLRDDEELAEMIEVLARLFRYNISRQDEYTTLSEELENVRDCVAIYNYRFEGRFCLLEQYEDMDERTAQYPLPVLTLQPFVENAIRHGLERKIGAGTLLLQIFRTQTHLIIRIQDDGVGMDEPTLQQLRERLRRPDAPRRDRRSAHSSGIALINVHQRLQLLFGAAYGMDVVSSPRTGTLIELTLPAEPNLRADRETQT